MKPIGIAVLVVMLLGAGGRTVSARDLEAMDGTMARDLATRLCREAQKIQNPQVKVTADIEKAQGVHEPSQAGVLIVPQKGLKEGVTDQSPEAEKESGTPLAYLFSYRILPVVNGQPITPEKLRKVKISMENGEEYTVYCMLVSARKVSDDDWRMYAFGVDKKPIVDVPFGYGDGPGSGPLAVEIKDVQHVDGDLAVTVFDQFQASFKVRYGQESP